MQRNPKPVTKERIIRSLVNLAAFPIGIQFLSGDWYWIEGWLFGIWWMALGTGVILYLYVKDPALLAERYMRPGSGNHKTWDRYYLYILVGLFISWIVVMPLDAKRFGWSPQFPGSLKIVGGVALVIAYVFTFRAFADNTFLSPLVRIQKERKQQVVSTGVYGYVRHPMYLGATLMFLGAPLMLGSRYGFGVGALTGVSLIARIIGEEAMLESELEGYLEYKEKVRYRLVPGLW